MMGLLFGKENEATLIFDSISKEYENLKKLTQNVDQRPTVLSGKQYSGFWSLPGGQSYIARFIVDAGGNYLYADDSETGSKTLEFESVYEKGIEADFWRFLVYSPNEFSYDLLVQEDERYADFLALKNKNVFICNTLKSPYFQKGLLEPQIILADYIKILHPEILPHYQPVYYHLLP
jgi:iron complex transport system substrate-binding protein